MKFHSITNSRFRGLKFGSLLAAACIALNLSAYSQNEEVRLKFGSLPFGPQTNISVNSGNWRINPSAIYTYEIQGAVKGKKGGLLKLIPASIPLDTLLNSIEPGKDELLMGSVENPDGALPFTILNRKISGKANIPKKGELAISFILEISIDGQGKTLVKASKAKVKLNGKKVRGELAFAKGTQIKITTAPLVQMKTEAVNVLESAGSVTIEVRRIGYQKTAASVNYSTEAYGLNSSYEPSSGTIDFAAGETTKFIEIPIYDDDVSNGFREFDVILSDPSEGAVLGEKTSTRVGIKDDDFVR